jgi:hypothetical protein
MATTRPIGFNATVFCPITGTPRGNDSLRTMCVSGTILELKQGTDPHPQGTRSKGFGSADGFKLSVLFYLSGMEE